MCKIQCMLWLDGKDQFSEVSKGKQPLLLAVTNVREKHGWWGGAVPPTDILG